jgi:tRNA(Ser,Leu) C12 N-acetylase TAN1
MVSNITLQQQHLNVYTCNAAVQIKFLTLLSIRTCTGTYINIYINTRTKDQKIQEQI